jgi:oxygen-independent coproporphyrinogen-3 oxidase
VAGIYIHIPFCDKACPYCDFYFLVSKERIPAFFNSLLMEVYLRSSEIEESIETIYFGGGTPSSLNSSQIQSILEEIYKHYAVSDSAEISIEMNPEHVNAEYLEELLKLGINRVSLGIQSFRDPELKLLGRQHHADKALKSLETIREIGVPNINLDLIMGIPGQEVEHWKQNLNLALQFRPEHFSIYMLSIEEGTPYEHAIKTGKMTAPSPELQAELYKMSYHELTGSGYDPYEISNYSLPGYRSKHNSAYWSGKAYLGLGPSAHSFINRKRYFNPPSMREYLDKLSTSRLALIEEPLSQINIFNEYLLSSLRRSEGIDLEECERDFGKDNCSGLIERARTALERNELKLENGRLFLSLEGRLIADQISMDLFIDEDES